jgi:crossover junction endodeoxyribonuclease RuvC
VTHGCIGIDPGLHGGISLISNGIIEVMDCPIITEKGKNRFDPIGMAKIVTDFMNKHTIDGAVLERAMAMPGQGTTSMLKTGLGQGLWEGILAAKEINYKLVVSRVWQKTLFGEKVDDTKKAAIAYVQTSYPNAQLIPPRCRVPKDGRADAICMSIYAQLLFT